MNPILFHRRIVWWGLSLLLFAGSNACLWGEDAEYQLVVPGQPNLSSRAVLHPQELVIIDSRGERFVYRRAQQFDTPDGIYRGYVSRALLQAVRFPTSGRGVMYLGDVQGRNWRASQQQVRAVAGRPRQGAGVAPPNFLLQPHGHVTGLPNDGVHLAFGRTRRGQALLGLIDSEGQIRLFSHRKGEWVYESRMAAQGLQPGAPLELVPSITPGKPNVFSIDQRGQLVKTEPAGATLPVGGVVTFLPSSHLTIDESGRHPQIYAVDLRGQLWALKPDRGVHEAIDSAQGVFPPGAPIFLLQRKNAIGQPADTLFLTDNRGAIMRYQKQRGRWLPRVPVADGFVPGGSVGAALLPLPNGQKQLLITAVDWQGQLRLLKEEQKTGLLKAYAVGQIGLTPGTHVSINVSLSHGLLLSAIGPDGTWRVWRLGTFGEWETEEISPGFPPGGPVYVDPLTGEFVAVCLRGRIVQAHYADGEWHCQLCDHRWDFRPRLVSRRVVKNPPLPPAKVTLRNGGQEEIILQISDALAPAMNAEIQLAPGRAVQRTFQRDSGGTIEEIYLVPGVGGRWEERVESYPIPPQPRYTLVVWANRTTYQYIDRRPNRPQGALPNFDLKTHVSLGVFDLPPGDLLQDGLTIDVYREATARRNPGAAAGFPPPSSGPTVVPKP